MLILHYLGDLKLLLNRATAQAPPKLAATKKSFNIALKFEKRATGGISLDKVSFFSSDVKVFEFNPLTPKVKLSV